MENLPVHHLSRRALWSALPLLAVCGGEKATTTAPTPPAAPVATTIRVSIADTLLVVTHTSQATATVLDQNGATMTGVAVTWRSSDTTVASVTATGQLTARASGSVSIVASAGGKEGSAILRSAAQVVTTLRVTLADPSVVIGAKTQATAMALDQVGGPMTGQTVRWSSANTSLATIDSTGRISTTGIGTSQIIAALGDRAGQASIQILPDPVTSTKFRAMAIGWYEDGLTSRQSIDDLKRRWIDHAIDVGYNAVQFQYNVDVNKDGSLRNQYMQTKMLALTDYARGRGLKVLWQVFFVYGEQGAAGYVASIDSNDCGSSTASWCQNGSLDKLKFLAAIDEYWSAQAAVAEAHGVSAVLLAWNVRLVAREEYRTQWNQIVAHVRSKFSGLVSYHAQMMWFRGWPRLGDFPFWDLMDFIGPMYNPQLTECTPAYDVNAVLQLHFETPLLPFSPIKELIDVSRKYGKPVMLSNIHYSASPCALSGMDDIQYMKLPNTIANPLPLDSRAQAIGMQGLFELANKNLASVLIGYAIGGYEPWTYQGPWTVSNSVTEQQAFVWNRWKYFELPENPASEQMITSYLTRPWGYHTTDITKASAGDDNIYVNSGTNIIYPKTGNDEVHGGTGTDTVVIDAAYASCTLTTNDTPSATSPQVSVSCGKNTARMWDVEVIRFTDRTITVSGGR